MKNIAEKLQEKRNIEVAKSILESNGYKVEKKSSKTLKESKGRKLRRVKESAEGSPVYWAIGIDAATNAPGTKYHEFGKRKEVGENLLAQVGLSNSGIEIDGLGYDDITFTLKDVDLKQAKRIAMRIASVAEEFSPEYASEYGSGDIYTVALTGPYHNEDLEREEDTETYLF